MKILFLHGLESTPETSSSAAAIKKAFGKQHEIIIPHYNPSTRSYYQIKWYIEDLCQQYNFDIVIGISLGGYWALHLTQFTNVKSVILLNPAIERGEERYKKTIDVLGDVGGHIILNMDDDIVDNTKNIERFKGRFVIDTFEAGGHRMTNKKEVIKLIENTIDHFEHNFI